MNNQIKNNPTEINSIREYVQNKFNILSNDKLTKEDIINLYKLNKNIQIFYFIGGKISGSSVYSISIGNYPNRYEVPKNRIDGRVINSMIKKNELIKIDQDGGLISYCLL